MCFEMKNDKHKWEIEKPKEVSSIMLVLKNGYPVEKLGLKDWEFWYAATFQVCFHVFATLSTKWITWVSTLLR